MSSLPDSFMLRFSVAESGCWLWKGHVSPRGYGYYLTGSHTFGTRRQVHAHRFAYEQLVGYIPKGGRTFKKCGNKLCVNPYHLEVGLSVFRASAFLQRRRNYDDGCVEADRELGSASGCLECPFDECVLVAERGTKKRRSRVRQGA